MMQEKAEVTQENEEARTPRGGLLSDNLREATRSTQLPLPIHSFLFLVLQQNSWVRMALVSTVEVRFLRHGRAREWEDVGKEKALAVEAAGACG
jgi:hypothetical protein